MTNAFTGSGLFGSLFSDEAIASEFSAAAFIKRMLEFESAWTHALGECGIVTPQQADAAQSAIASYSNRDPGSGSDRDGLPVPGLIKSLRNGLPEGDATAIHTGATSQDVIDTAMMLTCLSVLDILKGRLIGTLNEINVALERFGNRPLMARTRMQVALPASVALRLKGWQRPLADHLSRTDHLISELRVVQIGGPIGQRGNPEDHVGNCAQIAAEKLALSLAPAWHSDRSRIVSFGHWLTLVAGTFGKIGQDIVLMAQQGVDEVTLAGGGGSSAMPHKQNPIAAETMISLSRFVAGQQGILAQAMIHEQERSGSAWALEWLTLPAMAEAVGAGLRHAENLISSIEDMGTK